MVQFDEDFKQRMKERMERFSRFDQKGDVFSKVGVTVKKGNNLFSVANPDNQEFSWVSDESGPSPLAYFASSVGMCQMIHYGEHASSMGLMIDSLTIRVEGKFSVSRPRSFTEINYYVNIRSSEANDMLMELASNAASDCYITNTLSKACDVKGLLNINGTEMGQIEVNGI